MSDPRTFSERMYGYLLRLYPSQFREKYGDEALQLFRSRSYEEKGFRARFRLWFDLLFDFGVSLPREYRYATEREFSGVTALRQLGQLEGIPSFRLLESESPSARSVFCAGILSLLFLSAVLVFISPIARDRFSGSKAESGGRSYFRPSAGGSLSPGHTERQAPGSGDTRGGQSSSPPDSSHSAGTQSPPSSSSSVFTPNHPNGALSQQPNPQNATSSIIQAFNDHDVVMLGELHGNQQEYEWLCNLVKTPEFGDRVDDVVVEFGNSLYQRTIDRYIAGDDVPVDQVQVAWRDMIASVPPVSPVYGWFYQAIREANLEHRGKHQIRLIMGGPPGNWDKIRSPQDLAPYEAEREQWYAQVVKDEVLTKRHRALLIMGAAHFIRGRDRVLQDQLLLQQHSVVPRTDRAQVTPGYIERTLRAAGANPYLVVFGGNVVDNQGQVDERFDSWPVPAIAPVSENWLGKLPAQPVLTCGHAPATPITLAEEADAMLYVASCTDLRNVDLPTSELDGTPYGKEVARRVPIIRGLPPQ
jgi:hypothetical protein